MGVLFGVAAAQTDSTGIRLLNERKFAEAETFFSSAIRKNKKDPEAWYYLSLVHLRQQKLDDAEDAIEQALDLDNRSAKYHVAYGQILGLKAREANVISQGFLAPKVKNAFLRAVELDPANIEARQALFNYYIIAPGIMGGSEEKAHEQASKIVALDPLRGNLLLASYFMRVKNDTLQSERYIDRAIAADPTAGAGYKQKGYLQMNRKKFDDAAKQMQKYIDCEPANPDAYDSYADVLKEEKKFDQAIEKYLKALTIEKTFSPSIFGLAECYELKGEKQKAKETYQWYVTIEPQGRRSAAAKKKINEL